MDGLIYFSTFVSWLIIIFLFCAVAELLEDRDSIIEELGELKAEIKQLKDKLNK